MSEPESQSFPARQALSSLADGEASEHERARAFLAWRDDPDARATWQAYQLIGDVLRSDDLARPGTHCGAFVSAVRMRLETEPVVLAPEPLPVAGPMQPGRAAAGARLAAGLRRHWQAPAAMAAGFVAVMVGVQFARVPQHGAPGAAVASASAPAAGRAPVILTSSQAQELAPYVWAHRVSTMNSPLTMPNGDLQNASLVQPAR